MKKIKYSLILIFIGLFLSHVPAQANANENEVKSKYKSIYYVFGLKFGWIVMNVCAIKVTNSETTLGDKDMYLTTVLANIDKDNLSKFTDDDDDFIDGMYSCSVWQDKTTLKPIRAVMREPGGEFTEFNYDWNKFIVKYKSENPETKVVEDKEISLDKDIMDIITLYRTLTLTSFDDFVDVKDKKLSFAFLESKTDIKVDYIELDKDNVSGYDKEMMHKLRCEITTIDTSLKDGSEVKEEKGISIKSNGNDTRIMKESEPQVVEMWFSDKESNKMGPVMIFVPELTQYINMRKATPKQIMKYFEE